jgi:hypothetical protein
MPLLMQKSSPARVVVVSSTLMRNGQLDLVNQDPFHTGEGVPQQGSQLNGANDCSWFPLFLTI